MCFKKAINLSNIAPSIIKVVYLFGKIFKSISEKDHNFLPSSPSSVLELNLCSKINFQNLPVHPELFVVDCPLVAVAKSQVHLVSVPVLECSSSLRLVPAFVEKEGT